MKTVRLVLAVAGVLMAGGLASAQGPGGQGMGPGPAQHKPPMEQAFGFANGQFWNNPNLVQQLTLTDDQRKAMDGILQDHKMKLIDLRANLERAEVTLGPLIKADTPDQKAIEAQIDKVVMARAELEKANARFLLDIRMQLKPEQWTKLQLLRIVREERQRMQHERMGGDGRDGHDGWGHDGQGHDGQRPGMGGPHPGMDNQFRGPGGQFHRPMPGAQPPADAPQSAPAPPAPGSGDTQ
ncbi:MAG: periplasmic heavy metal sensor [Terracidiphilus sp.]